MAFGAQSPRRTNRDTVATGFTQRLAPIATATWKHLGIKASIGGTDDIPALPHLTNSSAPPTHDTFFRIVIKKGIASIFLIGQLPFTSKTRGPDPVFETVILQATISVSTTSKAIQLMVAE